MANQYGVNITTIALIYNYLANNNYSIDMNIINSFLEFIKERMTKKYQMYEIDLSTRNSDIFLNSFFIMGSITNKKILMLNLGNNLNDIYTHYSNFIPSELITETLNEEALQIIGVNKKDLKICTESKVYTKTEEVYEKNLETAIQTVKNMNSHFGTEEVKIINVSSMRKENRTVYNIEIEYTKTKEWIDESMFSEKQKIKKNRYTSYYRF